MIRLNYGDQCRTLVIASALTFALCGCSGLEHWNSDWDGLSSLTELVKTDSKDEEPVVPDRILAIWKDTVLHQTGKPAQRGFGGRLFFYMDNEPAPIEVEGSVIVYAFDASQSGPRVAPEKKFVFPAEMMTKHFSKSTLGPSYSFWLPWDQVGGETRQISLITRFEGTQGGIVISESARKLLPGVAPLDGPSNPLEEDGAEIRSAVDRFNVQAANSPRTPPLQTHTINLPTGTATRIAERQAQAALQVAGTQPAAMKTGEPNVSPHLRALEQHLVSMNLPRPGTTETISSASVDGGVSAGSSSGVAPASFHEPLATKSNSGRGSLNNIPERMVRPPSPVARPRSSAGRTATGRLVPAASANGMAPVIYSN